MGYSLSAQVGTFLTLAAAILLIFAEISQIRPSQTVPRHLSMMELNASGFSSAVQSAGGTAVSGIRNFYQWGLWAYCAGDSQYGTDNAACDGTSWGHTLSPASVLQQSAGSSSSAVASVLPDSTFIADSYLQNWTRIAFYAIFVAAVLAGLSTIIGLTGHRLAALLAAVLSFLGFVGGAIGAIIWTVIISKLKSAVNNATVGGNNTSLGLNVSYGNALWLVWGATAALFIAILPFIAACCFGTRSRRRDEEKEYAESARLSYRNSVRY